MCESVYSARSTCFRHFFYVVVGGELCDCAVRFVFFLFFEVAEVHFEDVYQELSLVCVAALVGMQVAAYDWDRKKLSINF